MKKRVIFPLICFFITFSGCNQNTSNNTVDLKLFYTEKDYFYHTAVYGRIEHFKVEKRTGYQFNGYFSEDGNQYSDELGVSINPWKKGNPDVLYGDYQAKTYTIQFVLDGGSIDTTTTYQITYDTDISYLNIPAPKKTNYTFIGFYTSETGGNQITDENTNFVKEAKIFSAPYYPVELNEGIIKFYARYEEKLINVNLYGLDRIEHYHIGESIYSFDYDIVDNKCFVGYYYDSEFQKKVEYPFVVPDVDRTIILYPKYEACTEKGLSYQNDSDNTYIANYSGNDEKVIIPDTYMGKMVTKVGIISAVNANYIAMPQTITSLSESSFENCNNLENLVISYNISSIPKNCFYGCEKLNSFDMPIGLTSIDGFAFYNCKSIERIGLSSNLDNIAKNSFVLMSSLKQITVDAENAVYFAEDNVLYRRTSSTNTLIKYPEAKEGYSFTADDKVSKINDYAFYGCSLRRIELSSTVVNVGEYAFANSKNLTYLSFNGSNRLTVGKYAFAYCSTLTTIILNVTSVVSIPNINVFENTYSDFKVFVPNSVYSQYLTNNVWRSYISNLIRMTMIFGDYCIEDYEDGVKIIAYFGSETNLTIPNYINGKSVLAIGENAFIFNEYLETIEFNSDLKMIYNHSFQYCANLQSVYINSDFVIAIEGEPFEIGTNFYLRNSSDALLQAYKSSWTIYKDNIWTAN